MSVETKTGRVLLAHGGGGLAMAALLRERVLPPLANPVLAELGDAALLPPTGDARLAFTTDGFVVDPIEFPGGDLGGLAVCGTLNDLAVAGADPLALSLALILEEGCPLDLLDRLLASAAREAAAAGVPVVCGDTKVVPRGRGDRIYAVTSGVGTRPAGLELSDRRLRPGDVLLASGPLGDHGVAVLAARHGLDGPGLRSDCAWVGPLARVLRALGVGLRAMHDPTRGGCVAVGHEMTERSGLALVLDEDRLPVSAGTATAAALLGVDPLAAACEGRLLAAVAPETADEAQRLLRSLAAGRRAAVIGRFESREAGDDPLRLRLRDGRQRPLDRRMGEDLPRIC